MTYGLAIMYSSHRTTFFEALYKSLLTPYFINYSSFTFQLIVVIAHLIWFFENGENSEQFPRSYMAGIDDAVWWAVVTLTTVGYGDRVTVTPAGRVCAVMWMIIGLMLGSILVGSIAAEFSDIKAGGKQLATVDDLVRGNYMVCSYNSQFQSGQNLAIIHPRNRVARATIAECGDWLDNGAISEGEGSKVIVMDSTTMKYWRSVTHWAREYVISGDLNTYLIGVAYPEGGGYLGRSLSDRINPAITDFLYSEEHPVLVERWFPGGALATSQAHEPIEWNMVAPAISLLAAYITVQLFMWCRNVPKQMTEASKPGSHTRTASRRMLDTCRSSIVGGRTSAVPARVEPEQQLEATKEGGTCQSTPRGSRVPTTNGEHPVMVEDV